MRPMNPFSWVLFLVMAVGWRLSLGQLHPAYSVSNFLPDGSTVKPIGMDFLPNGDLVVADWRNVRGRPTDVYLLKNSRGNSQPSEVIKIAEGIREPQGVVVLDGRIYLGDTFRLLKLVDGNGDGFYETKETVAKLPFYREDSLPVGNAYEFAFGPAYSKGWFYFGLGTQGVASNHHRGDVVRVNLEGKVEIVASGMRNPTGVGAGPDGEIFIADSQGEQKPSSPFIHVVQGRFYGREVSPPGEFQDRPMSPPAVWLPHWDLSRSVTQPVLMTVGKYAGQMFMGDVMSAIEKAFIMRVFLEKVYDPKTKQLEFQGACFPFTSGLDVGVVQLSIGPQGEFYVGGLAGALGCNSNRMKRTLQKLNPKSPAVDVFEMLAIRARKNGLEVEFTLPVGSDASQPSKYKVSHWKYITTPAYGGPKSDKRDLTVASATLSHDAMKVFLEIPDLDTGRVVEVHIPDLTSKGGLPAWTDKGWYTLNAMGATAPFTVDVRETRRISHLRDDLHIQIDARGLVVELGSVAAARATLLDLAGHTLASVLPAPGRDFRIGLESLPRGVHVLNVETGKRVLRRTVYIP